MKEIRLSRIITGRAFLPAVCLFLVLFLDFVRTPGFFSISVTNGVFYGFLVDVINRGSELAIIAMGMTLVVAVSGGVDISVGSTAALTAAVITNILSAGENSVTELQAPLIIAIAAGLLSAALCGVWNGFLVAHLNIQPMVATLILFSAGRGIAQLICGGQITYIRVESYRIFGSNFEGNPIPTPVLISLFIMLMMAVFFKYTCMGLYTKTVGLNSEAARLSGINPTAVKFAVYVLTALLAGIAGLISSSRIYSADANNIGLNLEMDAILAVILGGNSLKGGKFSIFGSVIGAYTIQALTTSLYAMGVSSKQLPVCKSLVILLAISLQSPLVRKTVRKIMNNIRTTAVKEAAGIEGERI